jgi:hypothetical protein
LHYICSINSDIEKGCGMSEIVRLCAQLRRNPKGVRFAVLSKVCEHYFGLPRQSGTSHAVYKTPWLGDPRVNIQNDNGMAKLYQVKQVLKAIARLEDENASK